MNFVCQVLWMVLLFLPWMGSAAQARRVPESSRFSGKDYVSATQWAQTQRFEARWVQREEVLQISSSAARVVLRADSREAAVNGVAVWLNHPVAKISGGLYVASLDLRKTLLPLLSPPRSPGTKVLSICIDPGHGGRDPGHQAGSNQEKVHTLLLAKELREVLSRAGFKTSITRGADRFVELPDRAAYANRRKADLFLSLHYNAAVSSKGSVRGAEVYCLTPAGADSTNAQRSGGGGDWCTGNRNDERNVFLAYQMQKSLVRGLAMEDRGVRRARFAVLRDATMPAVLIEGGFMSHPGEGRKLLTAESRRQLARAIADAVIAYKSEVER